MSTTSDQANTWTFTLNGTNFVYDPLTSRAWPVVQGGAEGDPEPGTNPGDPTGGGDPDPSGSEPGGTGTSDPDEKTLKQSEVNAIVAREVAKATRGKLDPKDLGFDTRKEMEEYLEARRKEDEARKSEEQKQFEEAVKAAKEEAQREILSVADQRLILADFKLKAIEAGVNPKLVSDAYVLAQQLESWEVEVSEKGEVGGLDDAFFEELQEAKPFLWVETEDEGGPGDIGARAGGTKAPVSREEELRRRYSALNSAPS